MIVYSDRKTTRKTSEFLGSLFRLKDVDLLIAFGQFEAGVVDALSPEEDTTGPAIRALRYAAISTARAWMGHGKPVLGPVRALELPDEISFGAPEGYAYYALYPEMYVEAARRFLKEMQPARTVVIGIRSIGTSLSAVVSAAVDAAVSVTVRPRGHPFDRYVAISRELSDRIRMQSGAHFLVVDEGPGISGSSFAAVAKALRGLGIPDERIVLFPSWDADASGLRSDSARYEWDRHRRYSATFEEVVLPSLGPVRDLSAGEWRKFVYPDEDSWPAVQPQHERRKYLREDGVLLKFAGLGQIGRAKLDRANFLADLGFAPEAITHENGFLATRWVPGAPATGATPDLVERLREYLELIGWSARVDGPVRFDELVQMIEINSGAHRNWDRALIEDAPLVAIDGRVLKQEWIATDKGWLKTDGVDHADDHFFPGAQDIAWDYAAASVEFDVPPEALTENAMLLRRIPFYKVAYCSYRLGYCTMARESFGHAPDGVRFARDAARYRAAVDKELG